MVKKSLLHSAFFHAFVDFFESAFNGFVIVLFFALQSFDISIVDADLVINAVGRSVCFTRCQVCGTFWNTIFRRIP